MLVRGMTTTTGRVAPGEVIEVTHKLGSPKRRTIVRYDVISTVGRVAVHNNDLPNIMRGLRERVFAVEGENGLQLPPRPKREHFEKTMSAQRRDIARLLRGCQPITSEKFLEHYKGAKRERYARAVRDNRRSGVPEWASHLSTFVKAEFLNLDKKPDPAPRVIQPRHPRYNAAVGVYIQPLEGRVYRAIAKLCGGPTVMKGYNADQVGKIVASAWGEFLDPVAVSLDASRFDQHVSEAALRWEHLVYLDAYGECDAEQREELAKLLEQQIHNTGYVHLPEADVKYKVRGNRMSGDMNTALGNCLLMSLMVRQFCKERSINFRLLDNGDDATVIMDKRDLSGFMADVRPWFLAMGFTMKVETPVYILEQIEFCQTHPVKVGGHYRMVRDPRVALSKDTTWKAPALQNGKPSARAGDAWLRAVGECGLALCGGIPIMQEFYTYLAIHPKSRSVQGFGTGESGFERMARGMCRNPSAVSDATRYSFWLAFGVVPDSQVALEGELRALGRQVYSRHRIEADSLNRVTIPYITFD